MSDTTQLLGISNAIVDILAHVDPAFIDDIGAVVGAMNWIVVSVAGSLISCKRVNMSPNIQRMKLKQRFACFAPAR